MTVSWKTTFENLFLHIFPKPPQTTNVAKLIPCLLFGMEGEFGGGCGGGGGKFQWIGKSIVLVVRNNAKLIGQRKFAKAQAYHTIKYTLTAYIATTYENLDWIDFVNIFDLINTGVLTHEYGLHKFPELTHLFSWFEHKKDKGVPLMGFECIPPSFWRLDPRKPGAS